MADLDLRTMVKQYAAAVNSHDLGRITELFDEQGLITDVAWSQVRSLTGEPGPHIPRGAWPRGREAVERYYRLWFAAVPDLQLSLYGLAGGPEQAALEFTLQGTHRGEFLGLPASGNRIGCQAAAMFHFMHGKIHEQRLYYDLATLQRQMTEAAEREVMSR